MTKKHFIALADMIRMAKNGTTEERFTPSQILMLARFCQMQNVNFDRGRWLDYIDGKCGPNGGEVK